MRNHIIKTKPIFLLILLLVSAHAQAIGITQTLPLNVFGCENRTPQLSRDDQWSAVGRLETRVSGSENTSTCTATLVAPNLILTAAHCVFDETTHAYIPGAQFFPNMINGRFDDISAHVVEHWEGTTDSQLHPEGDWAILRLDRNLDDFDYVEVEGVSFQEASTRYRGQVTHVGYSQNFQYGTTAGVDSKCSIRDQLRNGTWGHDCSNGMGASGGPLWATTGSGENKEIRIIAVTSTESSLFGRISMDGQPYSRENSNRAVPATAFAPTLQRLLQQRRSHSAN